jgi:hypothetical protein
MRIQVLRERREETYSVLLESWGVARFRRQPTKKNFDELRRVLAHLESVNRPRDDRREVRDAPAAAQALAKSVALLFDAPNIAKQADGTWKLLTEPSGLLSSEAFSAQRLVPGGLTGFLVGEDLLLTTHHDVDPFSLRIVFDFLLDANDVPKTIYSNDEVFAVAEVVDQKMDGNTGEDWLLLRLNKSPGRPFLKPIASQAAPLGTSLQMFGHPLGLPMKFVDGATVTNPGNVTFECDLDASQGNSGSAVLDSAGNVVGALKATAPAMMSGLWLWCPPAGNCPTTVTSSPVFAAAVTAAQGP